VSFQLLFDAAKAATHCLSNPEVEGASLQLLDLTRGIHS
jgi:hypothetical protein